MIDRRILLAGGAAMLVAATRGPDADARAQLDAAASLSPIDRLPLLRRMKRAGVSPSVGLDIAAAIRGAQLEAAIADAPVQRRYGLQLRLQSGTDVAPAAAYALAMDRVRLITARADYLLREEGRATGSVAARLRALARDPRYLYADDDAGRDRAVADMNRWLAAARARLPTQFGMVPLAVDHVSIRRMTPPDEAAGKAGYRVIPTFDGTTPGAYFVDLHEVRRRPSWSLPSVVHHETLPGHLLQLPVQERAAPHALRLRAAPGFVEGWATYAEHLAAQAGAFAHDRLAEIGCLQWLLFRLGRGIIDLGINAFSWSDEAALVFLQDLQGDPVIFVTFAQDIARAQSDPGGFAGHMLNWLGLEQLHAAALRAAGGARLFHDRVLANGALPLVLFSR